MKNKICHVDTGKARRRCRIHSLFGPQVQDLQRIKTKKIRRHPSSSSILSFYRASCRKGRFRTQNWYPFSMLRPLTFVHPSPVIRQVRAAMHPSRNPTHYPRGGRGRGQFSRGRGRNFKRARRGSGSERGRYKGHGTPFTPVEPGCRFFKKSFMENPWERLERDLAVRRVNTEEIEIHLDDDEDENKDVQGIGSSGQIEPETNATTETSKPLEEP